MIHDAFMLEKTDRRQRQDRRRERAQRELRRAQGHRAPKAATMPAARWDLALGATAGIAGAAAVAVAGQLLLEALRAIV